MEITVMYLKFHGINCRFNGLTWNYFFSRTKECQLITAYVILSIMWLFTWLH